MIAFEAGDIAVVDYPHVETRRMTRRPALIVSHKPIGPDDLVLWALMITSAINRGWPGDLEIVDYAAAGLPAPSVVRTEKVTTVETLAATRIGRIEDALLAAVMRKLASHLGLDVLG